MSAATKTMRQQALSLAALLAVTGSLMGCSRLDDYTAADLQEPPKRHPVGYTAHTEALLVEIAPGGQGLSSGQQADVYRFIDRYKKESNGRLRIAAPRSAGGHLVTTRSMREVETIVRDAGIDPGAVEVGRYSASSRVGPAVKLAYERPVAVPPECRNWSTDLGENRERLPYNDFGCATQRNLALTVANSRDLQVAQEETPRSSERRSNAWSDYAGSEKSQAAPLSSTGATPAAPADGGN